MGNVQLDESKISSFTGLQVLIDKNFPSSFSGKAKQLVSNPSKKSKFQKALVTVSDTWELSENSVHIILQVIWQIYHNFSKIQWMLCALNFYKKIKNKNKFMETPTLPLFKKVLGLHVPRLFYIAALWKRKSLSIPVIADLWEVD